VKYLVRFLRGHGPLFCKIISFLSIISPDRIRT